MHDRGSGECCPHCGWCEGTAPESPQQIAPRTVLDGRYLLGRALGQGGFGITYLGWDLNLNRKLAVKEYFPREVCTRGRDNATVQPLTQRTRETYESGLARFLEEGQALARFQDHPGVVAVLAFFRENGTGYIVMGYVDGLTFAEYLEQRGGKIDFNIAVRTLIPVMDTLTEVHSAGLLHRDISPDNIYITRSGQVKLLDFGAARYATGEQSRSLDVILKPGYAPEEQYRSRGKQGPWTDVYALGATLYRAITGQPPPPALDRLAQDDLVRPSRLGVKITPAEEAVLLRALALRHEDRYQTMAEFEHALLPDGQNEGRKESQKRSGNWWKVVALAAVLIALGWIGFRAWPAKRTPAPVPDIFFSVSPGTVEKGQAVTLRWDVKNASQVFLDNQPVLASDSRVVDGVTGSRIFHLRVVDAEGRNIERSGKVGILPPHKIPLPPPPSPPSVLFSGGPSQIRRGQSLTLRWTVRNATRVRILPGFPKLPAQGESMLMPVESTRYVLIAEGPGGSVSREFNVQVLAPINQAGPLSILTFTAKPLSIKRGATSVLEWEVAGAARVMILPDLGVVGASGSRAVRPLNTTQYTLVASAKDGASIPKQVTIYVSGY